MKHFKLFTVIALLIMAIPCNAQLTINIRYTAPKGAAKKYVKEMEKSGIAARIRAVEGCIRYDYFFPADDPDGLLLIDEWADQAALDRYHASPMMNEAAALREKYKLGGRQIRMFNPLAPTTVQPEKKTQTMNTTLTPRRQGLAVIASLEAKGDQAGLESALSEALNNGLTISEAKQITGITGSAGYGSSMSRGDDTGLVLALGTNPYLSEDIMDDLYEACPSRL